MADNTSKKKEVRRPLKPRDIKFVEAKTNNPDLPDYKAAMAATGAKDINIASTQAARMLQNVTLREALDATMAAQGWTIDRVLQPVKDGLEYTGDTERDTLEVRYKAHDRAVKLLQIAHGETENKGGNTFIFNNTGESSQNFLKK